MADGQTCPDLVQHHIIKQKRGRCRQPMPKRWHRFPVHHGHKHPYCACTSHHLVPTPPEQVNANEVSTGRPIPGGHIALPSAGVYISSPPWVPGVPVASRHSCNKAVEKNPTVLCFSLWDVVSATFVYESVCFFVNICTHMSLMKVKGQLSVSVLASTLIKNGSVFVR